MGAAALGAMLLGACASGSPAPTPTSTPLAMDEAPYVGEACSDELVQLLLVANLVPEEEAAATLAATEVRPEFVPASLLTEVAEHVQCVARFTEPTGSGDGTRDVSVVLLGRDAGPGTVSWAQRHDYNPVGEGSSSGREAQLHLEGTSIATLLWVNLDPIFEESAAVVEQSAAEEHDIVLWHRDER